LPRHFVGGTLRARPSRRHAVTTRVPRQNAPRQARGGRSNLKLGRMLDTLPERVLLVRPEAATPRRDMGAATPGRTNR